MDHCTRDVEELWLLSEEDPENFWSHKRGSLRSCCCVRCPVVGCLALNSLSLSSQWLTGCHNNPETHFKSMSHSLTIIQRFQNSLSRQLNRNDFSLVGQGAGKSTSAAMACITHLPLWMPCGSHGKAYVAFGGHLDPLFCTPVVYIPKIYDRRTRPGGSQQHHNGSNSNVTLAQTKWIECYRKQTDKLNSTTSRRNLADLIPSVSTLNSKNDIL